MTEKKPVKDAVFAQTLPPTTTAQEDKVTAGQRKINIIWEITQAIIAISITFATIYAELALIDSTILVAGFFLVVGVYLQRTNHQTIGGVGRKAGDHQEYKGR